MHAVVHESGGNRAVGCQEMGTDVKEAEGRLPGGERRQSFVSRTDLAAQRVGCRAPGENAEQKNPAGGRGGGGALCPVLDDDGRLCRAIAAGAGLCLRCLGDCLGRTGP